MKVIALSRGLHTIVDEADYDRFGGQKWFALAGDRAGKRFVAARTVNDGRRRRTILLHREILGAVPGVEVDHINRDALDNRRANLRAASRAQNNANSVKPLGDTPYRGVWLHVGRFVAVCHVVGKRHYLGRFSDALEAARAYDAFAKVHHGEFAVLNFPETSLTGPRRMIAPSSPSVRVQARDGCSTGRVDFLPPVSPAGGAHLLLRGGA